MAGRPVTVQNSFDTRGERGSSVTDQRHRFALSWIAEPRPFHRGQELLEKLFNDWKASGVITIGSGRPLDARISGDPNQDGNDNDRLPGFGRNAFVGPDYATTDLRLSRRLYLGDRVKLDLIAESFNLFNRDNQRVVISDDAFMSSVGQFIQIDKHVGANYFPAHFQKPANFMRATDAYAPRQVQIALKLAF